MATPVKQVISTLDELNALISIVYNSVREGTHISDTDMGKIRMHLVSYREMIDDKLEKTNVEI